MKRRRGYFKHFNDAYQGETLSNLMHQKMLLEAHFFWEIIAQANAQNTDSPTIRLQHFRKTFSTTLPKVLRTLSNLLEVCSNLSATKFDDCWQFQVSNYLKYQETRGRKKIKDGDEVGAKNAPIKDTRLKIKDKDKTKAKEPGCSFAPEQVFALWNSSCGPLPRAMFLTESRRQKIKALSCKSLKTIGEWERLFLCVKGSSFLCGQNDRGWRADLDFVLRKWQKILEGGYGEKRTQGTMSTCGFAE